MTTQPNPPSKPGLPPGFDARRLGGERIARRREHVSRIHKRVLVTAVTTFAIAWAAIFFQFASGHDPALSKTAQLSTVSSTASSSTDGGSYSTGSDDSYSTGWDDSNSPDSGSSASDSAGNQPVAPVTTQQS